MDSGGNRIYIHVCACVCVEKKSLMRIQITCTADIDKKVQLLYQHVFSDTLQTRLTVSHHPKHRLSNRCLSRYGYFALSHYQFYLTCHHSPIEILMFFFPRYFQVPIQTNQSLFFRLYIISRFLLYNNLWN